MPEGTMTVREAGELAVEASSAAGVTHCLAGVDFPCRKNHLVIFAREHGCTPDILNVIEQLPDYECISMAAVMNALGEIK
ncbi:MAG: DUF2795 domain-containing protein [Armatimonadetes bacterium]|nr:DUF2795 domain-containing protein [Armatimonadota bacterium]